MMMEPAEMQDIARDEQAAADRAAAVESLQDAGVVDPDENEIAKEMAMLAEEALYREDPLAYYGLCESDFH